MKPTYRIDGDTCLLEDGITKIGKRESKQIKGEFSKLVLPSTLKYIGESAFEYKILLKSVQFPYGLEEIGASAFHVCEELEKVAVPGSVTSIGKSAFQACTKLSTVELKNGLKTIDKLAFANCGLTSVKIPDSVTKIADCAFCDCRKLTSMEIPCSVVKIGNMAFYKTNISHIYLSAGPSKYKVLEDAFNKKVFNRFPVNPVFEEFMKSIRAEDPSTKHTSPYDKITIHVPKETEQDYKNHLFFGKFKIIVR